MRALVLTRTYENEYDDISAKLKEVVNVSEAIRDSTSLMSVLALILDIGNYMNDSNKQASGFKLSSLARLGMVKDDKNETTFADLIERIVRNQYSEWEVFIEDISSVVPASKLHVDQLRQDAKKYIDNIKNVQSSLDAGNLSDPKKFHPQDRVAQVVQRSMKEARRKAEQLQLYLEEASRTYDDIMTYFGEDNHLFLKPKAAKVATNLTVLTSRRHYQFEYTAIAQRPGAGDPDVTFALRFTYQPTQSTVAAASAAKQVDAELATASTQRRQNFDYWYCGGRMLRPILASDDGVHTRLRFAANGDQPAIFVRTEDGESLLNYSMEGGDVIIHRVADRFILRRGKSTGCIVNKGFGGTALRLDSGTVTPAVERRLHGAAP